MEMMSAEVRTDPLAVVFGACVPKEVSAESVVPDTMPDIDRILDAETAIYIRSKSIDDGEVTLDGVISAVVLYSSTDDEAVHKLELSVPASIEFRDGDIQSGDVLITDTSITSAETKMLNPRKILLRAETASEIKLLRSAPMDLSCAGTDVPGIELLNKSAILGFITSVTEKAFTINEEILLPDRAFMDELLAFQAQVTAESIKKVGSRAILQGMVLLSVLYTKEEEGALAFENFTVPYSQILEAPAQEAAASVQLRQSACYLEPIPGLNGAASLSLEINMNALLVCTSAAETEYVADAYSLRGPCETDFCTLNTTGSYETAELRQTIRDRIDVSGGVKKVISAFPTASLPAIGEGTARVSVLVRVMYLGEDDRLRQAVKRISAELPIDGEDAHCLVSQVIFREVNASEARDGIELRLETELVFVRAVNQSIRYVCSIESEDSEAAEEGECPSLIVIRPGEAEIWDLAKKYRSTCAAIREANPGGIVPDKLLLIPRARK